MMGDRDEALELGIRHDCGGSTFRVHPDGAVICIECNTELSGYVLVERQALERQRAADKFYQALGWMHAECCAAIDRGEDPRNLDCTDMVARCQRDLAAAPEANDG